MATPTVKELWEEFDSEFGVACPPDEKYRIKGGFYCGVAACLHIFIDTGSEMVIDDMEDTLRSLVKSIKEEMEAYYAEAPPPPFPQMKK